MNFAPLALRRRQRGTCRTAAGEARITAWATHLAARLSAVSKPQTLGRCGATDARAVRDLTRAQLGRQPLDMTKGYSASGGDGVKEAVHRRLFAVLSGLGGTDDLAGGVTAVTGVVRAIIASKR